MISINHVKGQGNTGGSGTAPEVYVKLDPKNITMKKFEELQPAQQARINLDDACK
jgi:hypothetical protein